MPFITLKKFNDQFADGKPRTVSGILSDAKQRRFSFVFPVYEQADYAALADAVEKALPAMAEIAADPHSVLASELELVRAERAESLSPRGIRMTVKDMRLWKVENGELRPEYVYANVREDDTDVYENRLVKALIDRVLRVLYLPSNYARGGVRTLYGAYAQSGAVSKYDLVKILDKRMFGARARAPFADYRRMVGLRRRAAQLRSSDFYRTLAHCRPFTDRTPRPTNLFLHDRRYRACAELWRVLNDFEVSASGLTPEERASVYSAFIALSMINAYAKLGYTICNDAPVENISKNFSLRNFVLENSLFRVTLSADPQRIRLLVQCPEAKAQQRYTIGLYTDTADGFSEESAEQMTFSLYRMDYSEKTMCVTPGNKNSQADLASFVRLTVLTVKANRDIYGKVCLICGSAGLEQKELCCECADCRAVYTFIDKNTVWLNRFRTLGEDIAEKTAGNRFV